MRIKDVIAVVDDIKPNSFATETKIMWLGEVEGLAQTEVMLLSTSDLVSYDSETDVETELLVAYPYDKIYRAYLAAMIDYANGEYNKYQNTVELFNEWFSEFVIWYADKYRPADGGMVKEGYYLSAYSLAVKHGYSGSEEEWLSSLKGEKGESGKGFVILGYFSSVEELKSAVLNPKPGDAYGVGQLDPYNIYVFDGITNTWKDNGTLKGDQGDPGEDGYTPIKGRDYFDGKDGQDGKTPYIGDNGNWYIGDTDTGVKARGEDGQNGENGQDGYTPVKGVDYFDGKDGKDGQDGKTPYIGDNGNWWIGDVDTGVRAEGGSGGGGGGIGEETDPTVPSWAKQPTKPTYTAEEVGALPASTEIPKKLSDLSDDSTHRLVTDSEKSAWNAKANTSDIPSKVSQLSNDSGYLTSAHNTSNAAHSDIRLLISGLSERLNALANSTDEDLDQLAEIVSYIKNNKSLIDGITTSKVNVSDIIDNLTTSVSNKPLSAKQGVALKALIDAIVIPTTLPASDVYSWAKQPSKPTYTAEEVGALPKSTKIPTMLSELSDDSAHRVVTDTEKSVWNAKANPSDIPTKVSQLDNDKGYLTAHQDLSGYAKKATTLSGYGITDGATRAEVSELSEQVSDQADLLNSMLGGDANVSYYAPTTITSGKYVSVTGTTVSSSDSTLGYTEKIKVKSGQTIKVVVASSALAGADKYISPIVVCAYKNGSVSSADGLNNVSETVSEYVVPDGVTEIIVSANFTKTGYSNPRIEITAQAVEENKVLVNYGTIRNDYAFSLPRKFYLRNGKTTNIYLQNLVSPNYVVKIGNYTDSTTIRNTDDRCKITANAVANKPIQYVVYDNHYNEIENGTMTLSILGTAPASQKMLIIGDSFVSSGEIGSALRSLFSADGNTLTLIGTKGSGANLNEGYSGKKYTDFANGFSGSPFGTSGFNFANYMSAQGYSGLNSVYIQLGTNDVSASNPNQDLSGVIDAMKTMINSIKAYSSSIKIYVGLTVMPNFDSEVFAEAYNGIGWNWAMKQNMIRLNERIIAECDSISNVTAVATNCILDATEDIRDNVHPTTDGFGKMAEQLYYTMMS